MAKDHYVPQFYLRYFCVPGTENVVCYQRNRSPFTAKPANIAAKHNYYSVWDRKGEEHREIDQLLGRIEGNTAPLVAQVLATRQLPQASEDLGKLAYLIAAMLVRTPFFRERNEELVRHLARLVRNSSDRRTAYEARVMLDRPEEVAMIQSLKLMNRDIVPLIMQKAWAVMFSGAGDPFVTSDNPVTALRPRKLGKNKSLGLLSANLLIPLSPSLALIIGDRGGRRRPLRLNARQVNELNAKIMRYAERFLFANIESRTIRRKFDQTTPPRRTPFRQIRVGGQLAPYFQSSGPWD